MFSFDHATGVMYTCDAFGAHYATDAPFDTELASLSPHFRFYYDCLMRPNARSVLTALRKVKDLDYTTIATGHGPIIRYNLEELVGRQATLLPIVTVSLHASLYLFMSPCFTCHHCRGMGPLAATAWMNSWAGNALWSEESCLAGGLHATGSSDDEQRLKACGRRLTVGTPGVSL